MTGSTNAEDIVRQLTTLNLTIATAESLTAGMLSSAVADIPGASAVLQGGVVAYNNNIKHKMLGVSADTLAVRGAVDSETAKQMAQGACSRFSADLGIATTGVAGPEPSEGKAVGIVFIALAAPDDSIVKLHRFEGSRSEIRKATVAASMKLMAEWLERRA